MRLANARASVPWQPVIEKNLAHLGLQGRAPPRAAACGQSLAKRLDDSDPWRFRRPRRPGLRRLAASEFSGKGQSDPKIRVTRYSTPTQVDLSRTVTIEFDANARDVFEFKPAVGSVQVHPGEMATVMYEFYPPPQFGASDGFLDPLTRGKRVAKHVKAIIGCTFNRC